MGWKHGGRWTVAEGCRVWTVSMSFTCVKGVAVSTTDVKLGSAPLKG